MSRSCQFATLLICVMALVAAPLSGCASSRDRNQFFERSLERPDGKPTKLFSRDNVRMLLRQQDARISTSLEEMFKGKLAELEQVPGERKALPLRMLALSGGVQWGAYGAGFLQAWHANRLKDSVPSAKFDIVTGVSTGALQATFAFIDEPAAYNTLASAYTGITHFGDVVDHDWNFLTGRVALAAITGDSSLYTTRKLRQRIERIITPEVLYQVKAGEREHRRLFVATTNLDVSRSWVWDLTRVASLLPDDRNADPNRVEQVRKLYVDILLASSAMPVLFPPVYIDSTLLDAPHSISTSGFMHCDGGVTRNVFMENFIPALPTAPRFRRNFGFEQSTELTVQAKLFVLINGKVSDRSRFIDGSYFAIGGSAISTVLNERMVGNIFFLQDMIERLKQSSGSRELNGLYFCGDVRIESIPSIAAEFNEDRGDEIGLFSFDNDVMVRLYQAGCDAWKQPGKRFQYHIRDWHAALRADEGPNPPDLLRATPGPAMK